MHPGRSISDICKEYPVVSYCLVAFIITWGLKYLYCMAKIDNEMPSFNFSIFAQFGPSLAALILIGLIDSKNGFDRILKSLINWRVGIGWIVLAISFEFVMFLGITLVFWFIYGSLPMDRKFNFISDLFPMFSTFLMGLFLWGLSEEIGWRGWMLPKLQNTMSPFIASLIISIVVTLWHANPNNFSEILTPKVGTYIIGYFPELVERLIITFPITLVITYIFNNTHGSLLLMAIFHSASNTSYFWVDDIFGVVKSEFFKAGFLIILISLAIIFSILVIRQDKKVTYEQTNC